MIYHRTLRCLALGFILLVSVVPLILKPAAAANSTNIIANPGFEDTSSSAWLTLSNLHNGTVTVPSSTRSHNGTYSAQLSAVNKTLQCPTTECKDSVRAEVAQNLPGNGPVVAYLANSNESFSAWWYVAPSSIPVYSLPFQLQFSAGSIIYY